MRKGYYGRQREEQQKGKLNGDQKAERDLKNNLSEMRLLKSVKAVMSTSEGELFIKWIIHKTKPFGKTFTNSGQTAFNLGVQSIGNMIIEKLIESGCELKITDLTIDINNNKLSDIEYNINLLKQKEGAKNNV